MKVPLLREEEGTAAPAFVTNRKQAWRSGQEQRGRGRGGEEEKEAGSNKEKRKKLFPFKFTRELVSVIQILVVVDRSSLD